MGSRILLVGGGNMGCALLRGWLRDGLDPTDLIVVEPHQPQLAHAAGATQVVASADGISPPDVLLLAIKPQMLEAVAPSLPVGPNTLLISILAGVRIALLPGARIVRAMPNTPAAIGRGISVAVGTVSEADRLIATRLLSAGGAVRWVDDETLLDAVTGLSGSGPAYVFHLVEALTAAGIANGLPAALAADLARATVSGAGALLDASPLDPAALRAQVTSPGGTTAAGLAVLIPALAPLMTQVVQAATARSRALVG
jgi:pyrroline-5-carboxylate reductase